MTYGLLYDNFNKQLGSIYDRIEATNITSWVFEHITGMQKGALYFKKNNDINKDDETRINDCLVRLKNHEPVQYVLNECWFYKEKYFVDKNVLIPRPETEELVNFVVKKYKDISSLQILDIGTGSGCIAISLKKYLPNTSVSAIDFSGEALTVAKKNALSLNTEIQFIQVDFLNKINWSGLDFYDIIVSNPPYIPEHQSSTMRKNVTDFEPEMALFVPSSNPLIFYKNIGEFALTHLKDQGALFVETHEDYTKEVQNLFKEYGFQNVEIIKDIYEKERFVFASDLFAPAN